MQKLPVLLNIHPARFHGPVTIACSGGADSMFAALYFMNGKRNVALAYFNHGTDYADEAEEFVRKFAHENNLKFYHSKIFDEKPKDKSTEEWYREQRYEWLRKFYTPVITGHHLDDAVETWVWGSCHGKPTLPALVNEGIFRPFLACKKEAMTEMLKRKGVPWIEDPSNTDTAFVRNHIRANVIPQLKKVNPGLDTVIQKKVLKRATIESLKQT